MKKFILFCVICLFGISNDLYAQATCNGEDITISSGMDGGTQTQHAENTLKTQFGSSIVIEGNAIVTYRAGTSITLNSGFKVDLGSQFKAEPQNCNPPQQAFIARWKIGSGNNTVTIPTSGSGYNFTIDWDDGTIQTGQTGTVSHTYTSGNYGNKDIKITGYFPRIFFNGNTLNQNSLTRILQWGDQTWSSMEGAFHGCSALRVDVNAGVPNLSLVQSTEAMFKGCENLYTLNENWGVSSIRNMNSMFNGATNFEDSLEDWDVSLVQDMKNMLDGTNISRDDYENTLLKWSFLNVQQDVVLGADGLIYCDETGRNALINNSGGPNWDIQGDTLDCDSSSRTVNTGTKGKMDFIILSPNPVENQLSVKGLSSDRNRQIQILDLSGRVLFSVKDSKNIDVSELKTGVYYIQILGEKKITKRFIKI